ncbi:MAG: peptidoglycan DL-endopeptidase CwlO [Pseudonocardiales bacterium]|jgi:cell wall-associated NlpC family hydrolase|nr:peptidoglycan DL-endopeptidase CwlO [Pseudonocardiales bacterium]
MQFVLSTAALVAALTTAVVVPSIAAATPDQPAPTVTSVQQRLGALALKNTDLVEKFDRARIDVATKQRAATEASAAATRAAADFDAARSDVSATMAAAYEGGSFSATGALLSSNSGQNYLEKLQTLDMLSAHATQVAARLQTANANADAASAKAATLLKAAKALEATLTGQRTELDKQISNYRTLLATLNSAQRADYQRALAPPVSTTALTTVTASVLAAPVSNKAAVAVKFALAQVGKPYVYGAAGPDSYDCSGLTMASWAAAGVSLPHSSEMQFTMGTSVSMNALAPGDLVFMYGPPPGHVTIYIGDGMMVSAPTEGQNVSVVPVSSFSSDIVGARRFG